MIEQATSNIKTFDALDRTAKVLGSVTEGTTEITSDSQVKEIPITIVCGKYGYNVL